MEKKVIKVKGMYLAKFDISGGNMANSFRSNIELTSNKNLATFFEIKDIPHILRILDVFGFDNCFAEDNKYKNDEEEEW